MFPRIQIQQRLPKIGIQNHPAKYEMTSRKATLDIHKQPRKIIITTHRGQLSIDQSKALDAYALGGHIKFMNRLYQQVKQEVNQGIARTVQEGNRLADLVHEPHAIADIARENAFKEHPLRLTGPASTLNVEEKYVYRKPDFTVKPAKVIIHNVAHPVQVQFQRGSVHFYMLQKGMLQIIPPKMNIKV